MKIHAVASMPHFREHVLAVWGHLPEALKGESALQASKHWPETDVVIVAAFQDIVRAGGRRVIYVEHGAGQKYIDGSKKTRGHYHGAEHPENVVGYICPRQDVADSWGRPAVAVGSPVCDQYPLDPGNDQPTAAIAFHWDAHQVAPEARSALAHYADHLGRIVRELRVSGFHVLGHHHPRDKRLPVIWKNLQVPVATVAQVRSLADVLIADNTSVLYEAMYLGRRTIALNAPWYRRHVEHGLRFWEHAPPTQAEDASDLLALISEDEASWDGDVTRYVYGRALSDGGDALRAAAWVTAQVAGM